MHCQILVYNLKSGSVSAYVFTIILRLTDIFTCKVALGIASESRSRQWQVARDLHIKAVLPGLRSHSTTDTARIPDGISFGPPV